MPYKNIIFKIKREDDSRVKLSEEQRQEIKDLYGKISQRKLAKAYGVSRRLIIFIGCPEKLEQNKIERKLRGGSTIYYNKDKQRDYMKKHRHHKQALYLQGKLEGEQE